MVTWQYLGTYSRRGPNPKLQPIREPIKVPGEYASRIKPRRILWGCPRGVDSRSNPRSKPRREIRRVLLKYPCRNRAWKGA